jgi:hypothetical protein
MACAFQELNLFGLKLLSSMVMSRLVGRRVPRRRGFEPKPRFSPSTYVLRCPYYSTGAPFSYSSTTDSIQSQELTASFNTTIRSSVYTPEQQQQ